MKWSLASIAVLAATSVFPTAAIELNIDSESASLDLINYSNQDASTVLDMLTYPIIFQAQSRAPPKRSRPE